MNKIIGNGLWMSSVRDQVTRFKSNPNEDGDLMKSLDNSFPLTAATIL